MKISSTKLSAISIRCRRTTAKHSTHNRIEDLHQNPDPNIINSLMSNAEKENDQALLTQLYELKGTYFLRMNNFEEAAKWFAKVPPSYSITHYDYCTIMKQEKYIL